MLYGERDEIIPPEPVRRMIERLPKEPAATRRIAWYEAGYHMLLRDLEAPTVLHDITSWIADQRAPLPSGADQRASAQFFARR
jgi:alpha-beta hydrolase superfamily lysophospholipase